MWNILGDGPISWSEALDADFYASIDGPLAWQEHALCAQTDPEAFFPKRAGQHAKQKLSASPAKFVKNACSTLSNTTSDSVFGAGCQSANAVVCVASLSER